MFFVLLLFLLKPGSFEFNNIGMLSSISRIEENFLLKDCNYGGVGAYVMESF